MVDVDSVRCDVVRFRIFADAEIQEMIKVENLKKKFKEVVAVDDVSFEVRQGETFALLGPNGSGKSTTLKCLAGLSIPTSGKLLVNDLDVFRNQREARKFVSYLPQRVNFHECLSAEEVLKFYCSVRKLPKIRIEEVLQRSHFNFNGFYEKRVSDLSGGMIQRLGLAVACLPDAPVLLLDEPTVSLDPEGAIEFRKFLKILKSEGKTIIFATHVLVDVEQLADRVAIMVDGKIVAQESVSNLREALSQSGRMRIALRNVDAKFSEIVKNAGASQVEIEERDLLISSKSEDRHAILNALKNSGAEIIRFSTEESALEDVYLRYARRKKDETV
jgi:ABC-type multidrug transport system ATPase subunit